MKRLIFTVMAVGLLMACGGGSTDTMWRLQQAEDVVEEHPDSAAGLLSQVVTTGMTEEETALYGLPSPPPSTSSAPQSAACARGLKGGRGKVFRFERDILADDGQKKWAKTRHDDGFAHINRR